MGGDGAGPTAHQNHDHELDVALLDRDLPEADRAAGQALIAECPSCAALHTDLVALARATVTAQIPGRTRDFSLTPAMAETLAAERRGEPAPARARLSHDMNDSRSRHAAHDRLLIANLVDRSVDEAERARAEELLAACRECEQLYDDLVALSAATRSMVVPARPRDFTLTEADAERLRIRGWRRVLAAIGSSGDVFSRPLALGLTTLGIAGLLFATIPSVLPVGGPTSVSTVGAPVDDAAGGAAENPEIYQATEASPAASAPAASDLEPGAIAAAPPGATAAPSEAAAEAAPLPSGDVGTDRQNEPDRLFAGGESSPLAGEPAGDANRTSLPSEGPLERSTMILVAGVLLVAGVGLFLLRWTARRLGDG
jgi:anti-sigma factor RsiW